MTGFDPTAPDRDTTDDEPDAVPDNVVPPEDLTDTDTTPAPSTSDEDSPA